MIKNLLQRMNRSAYVGRLAKTFPIFAFILILQLFLSVHLLGEGPVMQMGTRAFLQIWAVSTFRSLFWAALAWALVAWPRTKGWRRFVSGSVVIFISVFLSLLRAISWVSTERGILSLWSPS